MRLAWLGVVALGAAVAFGADELRFDIPRQPANRALTQFARQAGVSVLFPADAVRGIVANRVVGAYSIEEALERLLDDTGLDASLKGDSQISVQVVSRALAAPSAQSAATPEEATRVELAGERTASGGPKDRDEVIVTARRRRENLQQVPVSIVSLQGDEIELRGLERVEHLSAAVPNVNLIGGPFGVNQSSFTMRGIPRVATFVDGIWQAATAGILLKGIVDVDRVEILRGPQGTLYGRDSTGGAIRIVTRRPADSLGATVAATVGEFGRRDGQMTVDAPLGDTLRTRWTLAELSRDGYLESLTSGIRVGSLDNRVFRGDVVWQPTERVDARFVYERNRLRSNGQPRLIEAILPGAATSPIRLNVAEQLRAAGYAFSEETHVSGHPGGMVGKWQTRMDSQLDATDIDYAQYMLDVRWRLSEAIEFQSLTGVRRQYAKDFTDWDATETDMIEDDRRFLDRDRSQEFQLAGGRNRFRWVTGLYVWQNTALNRFFRFAYTEFKTGALDFGAVLAACRPPLGGDGKADCAMFSNQDFGAETVNEGSAAFGEVTIDLTERLDLTLGGRHHDERQWSATRVFAVPGPSGPNVDPPGDLFAGSNVDPSRASFDHFTRRLALSFDVRPDVMLYAGYAEGFNSGGVARLTEPDPATGANATFLYPYQPEDIRNHELGLRSDWLDGRLRVNATLFRTDWRGIQLAGAAPDPFNPGRYLQRTLTANVAAARARGLELELGARLLGSWDIEANVGLLDTEYTAVSPLTDDVAIGDAFGQAPELTASFGASRVWRLGDGADLLWRLDYIHTSEFTRSRVPDFQRSAVTGAVGLEAGDYALINTRLVYKPSGERWEVSLMGTNLANERYLNSGHTIPMWGWDMGTVGRPREWAATLRFFMR